MKIKYEYKIQKVAYLPESKDKLVPIGIFEEHSREGDVCKMTLKFLPNVPQELIDLVKETPQIIQMREIKTKAEGVLVIPEVGDESGLIIFPGDIK